MSDANRYLLTLEYDGTGYSGWQRQLNGPSVQQSLEEALTKLLGEIGRASCRERV